LNKNEPIILYSKIFLNNFLLRIIKMAKTITDAENDAVIALIKMSGEENLVKPVYQVKPVLPISYYTDEQKKERLVKLKVGQTIQFNWVYSDIYPYASAYKDKGTITEIKNYDHIIVKGIEGTFGQHDISCDAINIDIIGKGKKVERDGKSNRKLYSSKRKKRSVRKSNKGKKRSVRKSKRKKRSVRKI